MDKKEHWENVYATKSQDQMSWYRDHLDNSLKLILQTGVEKDAAVIDVGGGSSTLVDDLLDTGFTDISVVDISGTAITKSRERLGASSQKINWIVADITEADLPDDRFDVWHDRAVFHFLTDADDRRKYVDLLIRALRPGAHLIVAAFGLEGPQKCSGLDVVRYSPETMQGEFGGQFTLVESLNETHNTPFGTTQEFVYCHFKKLA